MAEAGGCAVRDAGKPSRLGHGDLHDRTPAAGREVPLLRLAGLWRSRTVLQTGGRPLVAQGRAPG